MTAGGVMVVTSPCRPDIEKVILASASPSRRRLLTSAGVSHIAEPADIDEDMVKESLQAEGVEPLEVVEALAELKAQRISARHPGMLVIGADQMLICDETRFDKPTDLVQAAQHLAVLSGRTHELPTVAAVVLDGRRIWHHRSAPRLTMRSLSRSFIADYLDRVGENALSSVGAYQLEGLGAQLFAGIDGDFFTILGLPLLPLMDFLRARGALPQ